jgi:hypothetical protein
VEDDLLVAWRLEDRYHQVPCISSACQPAKLTPVQSVPGDVQSALTARSRTSIFHSRKHSA